jgi:GntR family transcriptional repressor for pyruvate dehydrogenase complex
VSKIIKRESISNLVIEQINQNILDGELKPGDSLPSFHEIASMMNVGISSVREAITALEYMDIIRKDSHGNIYINNYVYKYYNRGLSYYFLLGKRRASSLFETREILEPRLSYLAAQKANKDDIDDIYYHLLKVEKISDDPQKFIIANKNFHLAIAKASKNNVLIEITHKIKDLIVLIGSLENVSSFIPQSLSWHRKIFNAIKLKNPQEASSYMREHIRNVYRNFCINNASESVS